MKTILVTGDWVADWNLTRPANLPEGYFDSTLETQLLHRAGGAWYVEHLISQVACRDLTGAARLRVEALRKPDDSSPGSGCDCTQRDDLAHAYSVWEKHRRQQSGKADDQVWRISRFAGCRKSTRWVPQPAAGKPDADLVVVDDLGLGFADQAGALAHVTSHAGPETRILLKHGVRKDGSGLLAGLLAQRLGDRLHAVAAASALRRRNAALSQALSWDQVLEDIEAEFKTGASSRDLARCATAVVHFGLAGAAVFHHGRLHRLYFLPDEMEHDWEHERPGSSFGTGSVLTACLARHLIAAEEYPLFFAVTQALSAQRVAHETGGGSGGGLDIDLAYGPRGKMADPSKHPGAECVGPPPTPKPGEKPPKTPRCVSCLAGFRAAWNPEEITVWDKATSKALQRSRLLCNATGTTAESFRAKAVEIVLQGTRRALASAPKASYEKYLTADRDEIESINELRRLILEYKANPEDKRPLSIAVFGAPGSGKSFAIKQVAKALFGKDKEPLEFNLTQIKTQVDLHRAFHQVRDASIRSEIPFVFWDEFDTANLMWLADFLAPMQDAEFFDGSHRHPFGKCVFVFAGGTRETFAEFKQWRAPSPGQHARWAASQGEPCWHESFKAVKGPDFISRLRGFLNVKGPNPAQCSAPRTGADRAERDDPAYVLRRAHVLRSEIERLYPNLIHPETKRAAIAPNVLHALLSVQRYEHGARSIAALLTMSALTGAKTFTMSALPARPLLSLHVSEDFWGGTPGGPNLLDDPVWTEDLILALAKAGHAGYRKAKPKSPDDIDWTKLPPSALTDNLDPVPRRLIELRTQGWEAVPEAAAGSRPRLGPAQRKVLLLAMLDREHRIWLGRRLAEGFAKGPEGKRHLRLNTDIVPFDQVADDNQQVNVAIMNATLDAFAPAGFALVEAARRGRRQHHPKR